GEIEAAADVNRAVEEGAEGVARAGDAFGRMRRAQVEDDAGVVLAGPREKGGRVRADGADGAVDVFGGELAQDRACRAHERGEARAGHEYLADHEGFGGGRGAGMLGEK